MKSLRAILIAALLMTAPAFGQQPGDADPGLDEHLFPPDLVMRLQRDIDLSEEQTSTILEAVRSTQHEMIDVQWKLNPQLQSLRDQLANSRIDEDEVRTRLARIIALEAQAKELQLLLMVRVKNTLTPSQQQRLRELR